MKSQVMKYCVISHRSLVAAVFLFTLTVSSAVQADRINLRIASGHPPGVVYVGLMKDFFQPELKRRVE